jgi:hypothetical protein
MNDGHFAIVVGISSYPNLAGPPPGTLKGPEADANEVFNWLTTRGGLLARNVKKYVSTDFNSPPKGLPAPNDLNDAMRWLQSLADQNRPRRVGERIYLYFAGHGFAPRARDACLITGNAYDEQFTDGNISPTAWLDWLLDSGYFSEYILWMDCCMSRLTQQVPAPSPLPYSTGGGAGPTRKAMVFAAPQRLQAVEAEIPPGKGQYHGVFTWNLIQGLNGAARDKNGDVTGLSLFDWLRAAQLSWLDGKQIVDPLVAKEPQSQTLDEGITFATGLAPFLYDIILSVPDLATDQVLRLWSGDPLTSQVLAVGPKGRTVQLEPGVYLAETDGGIRHGFTVTRSTSIELNETGATVILSQGTFILRVNSSDPMEQLFLYDKDFNFIAEKSSLTKGRQLRCGLYLLRIWTGNQVREKILLLDGDWPPAVRDPASNLPQTPQITSAAPLPDTRTTHEYHQAAAATSTPDITIGQGAELMVMARRYSDAGPTGTGIPWKGVALLAQSGEIIADLEKQGRRSNDHDPWAACSIRLEPGPYKLRYPIGAKGQFAQSLIAPPGGWRLEAYLLDRDEDSSGLPAVSILMRKIGGSWGGPEDLQLQKAIIALANERHDFDDQLAALLLGPTSTPLARIVGAHLLILSCQKLPDGEAAKELEPLNHIVEDLRNLVGKENPDVEALSLKCPDTSRRRSLPLHAAPMFERSWRLLMEGARSQPELVPGSLWQGVSTSVQMPPYLVWSENPATQASYQKALQEAIYAPVKKGDDIAAPATHDLQEKSLSRDLNGLQSKSIQFDFNTRSGGRRIDALVIEHEEIDRRLRYFDLPPAALEILKGNR